MTRTSRPSPPSSDGDAASFAEAGPIPEALDDPRHVFVADTEEKLRVWLPSNVSLEVRLSDALAPAVRELAERPAGVGERVTPPPPAVAST